MRRIALASLCLTLALAGCKGKEAANISEQLAEKGTTDLMKEVADDQYDAPADGKMTDAQVQMYIKVREREQKIAEVAKKEAKEHADKAKAKGEKSIAGMMEGFKGLGSVADLMTADIRAAKELGYNTQEYLWVKGQILEVSGAAMAEQMNTVMNANFDTAYAQAKKAYDEATDETTKKMYKEMLDGYDKTRKEMAEQQKQQESENPALAHNRELVKKHQGELNAWAQEMAKFSDQPAEQTQKAVDDWQKQVDQAAKKQ